MTNEKWKIYSVRRSTSSWRERQECLFYLSFYGHGYCIAAAETQGNNSPMRVSTLQLVKHRGQQPRTGLANRMTQGNGAAVNIDARRIKA
jgi:hypothetical protein